MEEFQTGVNYHFRDAALLAMALTHSSYGYENSCPHNERLEFLGDAILGYVVSRELFLHFPNENEGTLSKLKSVLVSSQTLARKAREISLGAYLKLGKGEQKAGGRRKPSILADAMEALIGAISLDKDLAAAEAFIKLIYKDDIKNATLDIKNAVDFKTLLQERLQEKALGLPSYRVAREEGPAHNRRFLVRVSVGDYEGPIGRGSSKKLAQQDSAKQLLEDRDFWHNHANAAKQSGS